MREIPISATGLLHDFCLAGMLQLVDFHLARRICQLAGETQDSVVLACALAVRELRLGSICLDISTAESQLLPEQESDDGAVGGADLLLAWPEVGTWLADIAASVAVATEPSTQKPFYLHGTLLYLDRYWRQERALEAALVRRSENPISFAVPELDLPDFFDEEQVAAVRAAVQHPTTLITGGPGTGKTTIVAAVLSTLAPQQPRIALAAPTAKARARLVSAVAGAAPTMKDSTLHGLLGMRPRSATAEFGPGNPLPFDVIVVDETSMVSLEMMAALLSATAASSRLILLGDPHQLRSVDAGAVLADIAESEGLIREPGGAIARLSTNHRSNEEINRLAKAMLDGDFPSVRREIEQSGSIEFIHFDAATDPASLEPLRSEYLAMARDVRAAAAAGQPGQANEASNQHRVLCGHREGPFGVGHWSRALRTWLGTQLSEYGFDQQHYVGQPLMLQRNSDLLNNGDTAVVIADSGKLVAAIDRAPDHPLLIPPALLEDAVDLHAMTIHKSQGSQFGAVSVVLPPEESPLLTRELIYTAITRAKDRLRIYGSWESLEIATNTPARRASGLNRAVRD